MARFFLLIVALGALAACQLPANLLTLATATPDYHPPAEIAQLANAATMTDKARALFYATRPGIDDDRTVFEQHCQAPVSATTVELGCYTTDNRIYILRISPPQLSEMMVVTAAHEMLHAAYAQLAASDRATLTNQLEAQVTQIHDGDLAQELRQYRVTEPGQRDNELHSIIGTEYAPLSPALEQYYRQYFANRMAVVNAARQFNQTFAQLQATLDSVQAQINTMRQQMDADRRRGNVKAYNALVPKFNALVQQYNQTVEQYNALSRSLIGVEAPASTQQ
ncbi:MAG: hypothetical protein WCF84_25770 [Anaerolineae bacterium]